MHHKIADRLKTVLIFDHEDDVNYTALTEVFIYGDRGFMFCIHGPRFYTYMAVHGAEVMKELGVVSLAGYVVPGHERLMRIALRRVATVEVDGTGQMAGHEMTWVIIRLKKEKENE